MTFLLAACGDDDAPAIPAAADVKPVVVAPIPTSVEGRWRLQLNKPGASHQIWEIQSAEVREIGICRSGWSGRSAAISALAEVNSSELKILEDVDVPLSAICYAGLRKGVWLYQIVNNKLVITDAADSNRRFEGAYLGPIISP